ncbi:hypothetical protein KL86PLE_30617 [uncultured Pleomorphomonas sp.]|uniref:Polysaccharide chain length determinant N-terminal domain-containing protein n=1 Tax=uncultured Pleomorphomonas sp. TaxID=442121 RepID=A0A212LFB9_9HYPH|nr:GumC family protein [uncultured Pleomorphomonas sp.]SCM76170.1 hypothetical protein KL86PLE_30617 [uncultured Pleomorphomonas sp.]
MKIVEPEYPGGRSNEASLAEDLRILARAFSSRWRLIAGIAFLFVVAGFAVVWLSPKTYTSSVSIFIDPRERGLVDLGVAPTGMGSSSQGADGALVDSQMAILTSRSVLGELVERERLDTDPTFNPVASGPLADLRGLVAAALYGTDRDSAAEVSPFDRALAGLQKAVAVKRVDNTYVLDISVATGSPARSAALANALADIYLSNGQSAVDNSARESAASLEARLAELGKVAEQSQRAVEDYRRENGLLDTDGVPLAERQVVELSSQLVSASVAVEAAKATLETLRDNGVGAFASETASQLRMQIGQARAEENMLSDTYGPRHPRLVRAQEQRKALENTLNAELARVLAKAEADYKSAVGQRTALQAIFAKSQDSLAQSNAASVKLKELEQTAKQNRELFDSFAVKAKQAREQISLPTTTARIISPARPSIKPSAPKALLLLAASAFLGCVAGFGTAWLLYLVSGPPKRRRPVPVQPFRRRHLAAAE